MRFPFPQNRTLVSYEDISRFSKRIFKFKTEINLGLLYTPIYPTNISREATAIASINSQNTIDLSALNFGFHPYMQVKVTQLQLTYLLQQSWI